MFRFTFSVVIGYLLMSPISVFALEQTYTFSKSAAVTTWNVPTTSLNYFDSSLGTLTSVKIDMNISYLFSGTIKNTGSGPSDYSITPTAIQALTKTQNISTSGISPNWISINQNFDPIDITGLEAGQTTSWSSPQIFASNTRTYTNAPDLASFTGSGQLPTYLKALGTSSAIGDNAYELVVTPIASGSVTITYTYTPIPEPGSIALAGISAGLLALMVRRRRNKNRIA